MKKLRFDGKVAIVTGAGGGIGNAIARLLAERGAAVLVNDLGTSPIGEGSDKAYSQRAADAIRAAGGIAEANGNSVATAEGANAIVKDAIDRWGHVDILVNNAGFSSNTGPLETLSPENWEIDMAVSASGTFNMCRAVWEPMKARNYGRIINTCSTAWFGMGSSLPYPAAKGAVWGIMRALASAAGGLGVDIKVNAIMPIGASRISTQMGEVFHEAMTRKTPPEAIAPVVGLLGHEQAPCSGEMFMVGGGGFCRVFAGVTEGYQSGNPAWSIEDAQAHFDDVMRTDHFTIPKDFIEANLMYKLDMPWEELRAFIC